MLLSLYKEKNDTRIKTAYRNNDSSHFKQFLDNYSRLSTEQARSKERLEEPKV